MKRAVSWDVSEAVGGPRVDCTRPETSYLPSGSGLWSLCGLLINWENKILFMALLGQIKEVCVWFLSLSRCSEHAHAFVPVILTSRVMAAACDQPFVDDTYSALCCEDVSSGWVVPGIQRSVFASLDPGKDIGCVLSTSLLGLLRVPVTYWYLLIASFTMAGNVFGGAPTAPWVWPNKSASSHDFLILAMGKPSSLVQQKQEKVGHQMKDHSPLPASYRMGQSLNKP